MGTTDQASRGEVSVERSRQSPPAGPSTVAVVIPNYNHALLIGQALDSVLAQTLRPTKIIVVDDGSTDNSIEVIESYAQRYPEIRIHREQENTRHRAHEYVLGQVANSGEVDFIYSLAADDLIAPSFLARAVEILEQHPAAGFAAAIPRFIRPDGKPVPAEDLPSFHSHAQHVKLHHPCFLSPAQLLDRLSYQPWFIGGMAVAVFRSEALAEAGPPDAALGMLADWFLVHSIGLRRGMCYIPEPLVEFRLMPYGFGSSVVNHPSTALASYALTIDRMCAPEWRAIFPPDFVAAKRREFTYVTLRGALVSQQSRFLDDWRTLLPANSLYQRAILRLARWVGHLQRFLVKAYCHGQTAPALRDIAKMS